MSLPIFRAHGLAFIGLWVGLAGCSRRPSEVLPTAELVRRWADPGSLARLDLPDTALISSVDPTGGNEDYNHPLREGPEGWVVLADLKGPGYVSRFWFTGADDGRHRLRLYFDGERRPSLDLSLAEFCGGREPWRPPLAAYENYCWFNLVPIPYRKRLIIMTQAGATRAGGWPRLFFQINHSSLPPGMTTEEFRGEYSPAALAELEKIRQAWQQGGAVPWPSTWMTAEVSRALAPGESADLLDLTGPAILWELAITPEPAEAGDPRAREELNAALALKIFWDGAEEPSVETPFGPFFGQLWRRVRYLARFFGLTNDTFVSRFPMPFEKRARIRIENPSRRTVNVTARAAVEPLTGWTPAWGYLHAHWARTSSAEGGKPHPILETEGRGKYVGCLLAVMSEDRSWWILEGDEEMRVDGVLRWRGTGLEDYFNGGWYYQNVLARPVHGVPFKAFFRVVQYRLHLLDAPRFNRAFSMQFERGPDHASHGTMESVAWYYRDRPAPARSRWGDPGARQPPADPLAEATVMTELLNYERLGDYRGAKDYLEIFLADHPKFPRAPLLRLRRIAYLEKLEGVQHALPAYRRFLNEETDPEAREQARLLLWFHESPDHALVSLWSTAPARALLDGQEIVSAGKPERAVVTGVTLASGRHVLALHTLWSPYPGWLQAALRTHERLVVTTPTWKHRFRPSGPWSRTDYNDADWVEVGGTGVKGPPEEPYIWMEPNGFVDLQSQAIGLRAPDETWPDKRGFFVFRHPFELP